MFLTVSPTHEPHHKPQQKQQQHFLEIIELKLNQQRKAHMETNNFLSWNQIRRHSYQVSKINKRNVN